MRDTLDRLEGQNAELLAIDPHESWSAKYLLRETGFGTDDLQYPMLMDPSLTVSATYGLCFQMRIHTEWSNRPTTFIIDREGVVRYMRRAQSFGDRPSPGDIVAELEKLR